MANKTEEENIIIENYFSGEKIKINKNIKSNNITNLSYYALLRLVKNKNSISKNGWFVFVNNNSKIEIFGSCSTCSIIYRSRTGHAHHQISFPKHNMEKNTSNKTKNLYCNHKKKILQVSIKTNNIIKQWDSAIDAEKSDGYNSRRISQVCKGKAYSSNGYFWKYADPNLSAKFPIASRPKNHLKDINPIGCYNIYTKSYVIFNNLTEVLDFFQTSDRNLLRYAIRNTTKFISTGIGSPSYYDDFIIFNCHSLSIGDFILKYNSFTEQCKICIRKYRNSRSLSTHLQSTHNVSSKDYTIKYFYGGLEPTCAANKCHNKTRYTTFGFKKYCKQHASIAMKEGGTQGAWRMLGIKEKQNLMIPGL